MKNVIKVMMVACGLLAAASVQAATTGGAVGRDFNHAMTGFALSGSHAATACETCHVGGVFKGTPRNCDECHATGRRIVATPKSPNHIVTTAQCDTCHFNTVTFLGARFNHGTAKPGECNTCHNGRIARGKHATHISTALANDRCDACHRSSAWVPASWNHNGVTGDCVACHKPGGPGRDKSAGHLPMSMGSVTFSSCRACHTNFYSFAHAFYDHAGAPETCQDCHGTHNAPVYSNVKSPTAAIHGVIASLGVNACTRCHTSFNTFGFARFDHVGATNCVSCHSGAYAGAGIRGKSTGHVAYFGTTAGRECDACHTTRSWASTVSGQALHQYLVSPAPHDPTCRSCHNNKNHDGDEGANASMDCSTSSCHKPVGSKGSAFTKWD